MSSREFYEQFNAKLLKDYLSGNKRMLSSIKYAIDHIPSSSKNILDIGCGIGWSSFEFKKHFSSAHVDGIDLSSNNVGVARELFAQKGLNYHQSDFIDESNDAKELLSKKFDVVVMLDVYEHFSISSRKTVHNSLRSLLSDDGILILACPTKYHQQYLRDYNPQGLQPVDEDVDFNDIVKLSVDLNCDVLDFIHAKIWRPLDYFYVTMGRDHQTSELFKRSVSNISDRNDKLIQVKSKLSAISAFMKPCDIDELKSFLALEDRGIKFFLKKVFK